MKQLPQGWINCHLFEISEVVTGKTPSKKHDEYFNGAIPFIKPGDVRNQGVIDSTEETLTEIGADTVTSIPPDSITVTCIGNLGRAAITKVLSATNQQINSVIPYKNISTKFLYYYLRTIKNWMESEASSTTVTIINKGRFLKAPLILPPANEQIRIADKLDSVLAKVDAAQARLEKIPTLLRRFRQSVLAAATSGELTREWRGASENRDDFLTWKFSNIPGNWKIKLLPEVSEARLGKMLDKNKNQGVLTRYLGNINVRWERFDLEDLKEILISEKEREELKIQNGDLLICEGGEPGRGAVWKGGKSDLTFQKALHRVRFNESVLPDFALFCIENDYIQNRLSLLYTGTTIKHLTGKALDKYPIVVPPPEEQKEIVRRVESLFALADTVEKQYLAAKQRLNRLSQSLLTKAFRGELVPQDPNDEPAAELLKRIQAERHAQPQTKRNRKQPT